MLYFHSRDESILRELRTEINKFAASNGSIGNVELREGLCAEVRERKGNSNGEWRRETPMKRKFGSANSKVRESGCCFFFVLPFFPFRVRA